MFFHIGNVVPLACVHRSSPVGGEMQTVALQKNTRRRNQLRHFFKGWMQFRGPVPFQRAWIRTHFSGVLPHDAIFTYVLCKHVFGGQAYGGLFFQHPALTCLTPYFFLCSNFYLYLLSPSNLMSFCHRILALCCCGDQ